MMVSLFCLVLRTSEVVCYTVCGVEHTRGVRRVEHTYGGTG